MGRHAFTDNTLQSRQTDAVLVLKQFTDTADTAVAEVIDIIRIADAVLEMHIVVDGSKNVFLGDVLRNKLVNTLLERISQCLRILVVLILEEDLTESRIINLLMDSEFFRIAVNKVCDVNHKVAQHLDIALFCLNYNTRNSRVLNGIRHLTRNGFACAAEYFAVCLIDDILCEDMADNTVAEGKLLIKFITADLGKIIAARIKQHRIDQAVCRLHRERFAWTNLLVEFEKTGLVAVGRILRKCSTKLRLVAEDLKNLVVGAKSKGTKQNGYRHFSRAVNTDPEHIVHIGLIFEPCAAVRDHRAGIHLLAELILVDSVIDTGRADQLRDNDTLCAIDDKRSVVRHDRHIAHKNFLFGNSLVILLVVQTDTNLQRSRVCRVSFLALFDVVLDFILAESVAHKRKAQMTVVVLDGTDVIKRLLQTFLEEPAIGGFLDFNQIGHFLDFLLTGKAHPHAVSAFDGTHPVFVHSFLSGRFAAARAGIRKNFRRCDRNRRPTGTICSVFRPLPGRSLETSPRL